MKAWAVCRNNTRGVAIAVDCITDALHVYNDEGEAHRAATKVRDRQHEDVVVKPVFIVLEEGCDA